MQILFCPYCPIHLIELYTILCVFKDVSRKKVMLLVISDYTLYAVMMLLILFHYRQKHEKGFTVCGMAWHPSGGRIAYTDTEGCLGLLEGVSSSSPSSSSTVQSTKVSRPFRLLHFSSRSYCARNSITNVKS